MKRRIRWDSRLCGTCAHLDWEHGRPRHAGACSHGACACLAFLKLTKRKYSNEPIAGSLSRGEHERYKELRLLQSAGAIRDLRHPHLLDVQPPGYERITWNVDYTYWEVRAGHPDVWVIEDFKGNATKSQAYGIQKKLAHGTYKDAIIRTSERDARGRIWAEDEPTT